MRGGSVAAEPQRGLRHQNRRQRRVKPQHYRRGAELVRLRIGQFELSCDVLSMYTRDVT
jgi:hypothetical protein